MARKLRVTTSNNQHIGPAPVYRTPNGIKYNKTKDLAKPNMGRALGKSSGPKLQSTMRSAQMNKLSPKVEMTPNQMLRITPRMLNNIKSSPKGVLPSSLKKYAK